MKTTLGLARAVQAKRFQGLGALLMKMLRRRECPHCGCHMQPSNDKAAVRALLTAAQRLEQDIGSVTFVLWECQNCPATSLEQTLARSGFRARPHCSVRAWRERRTVVTPPTHYAPGLLVIVQACVSCHHHWSHAEKLERRLIPNSVHRPGDFG